MSVEVAARKSEETAARATTSARPSRRSTRCATRPAKLSQDNDTNYIFLSFVTRYLPRGLVGLIIGVIFTAAMSASSGEINSLATVSMIDVYQRHFHQRSDRSPLSAGLAHRDSLLGNLRRRLRQLRPGIRRVDRGGESGRLAILRQHAGRVRGGVLHEARRRHRSVLGRAGRARRPLSWSRDSLRLRTFGTT